VSGALAFGIQGASRPQERPEGATPARGTIVVASLGLKALSEAILSRCKTIKIKNITMKNNQIIIGVDEAGRGPWAGPVVAAAVYLPEELACLDSTFYNQITDSKKISETQREKVFSFLEEKAFTALGAACPLFVDKFNILEATFFAMRQSILNLQKILKAPIDLVLVDGNQRIPGLRFSQEAIVKGDILEKSIAAASIIAKVRRDRLMMALHKKYPQYGFANHKGYGTIKHKEALDRFGICAIHRKSFRPIASLMKK